jgi:hypothetical protein
LSPQTPCENARPAMPGGIATLTRRINCFMKTVV